jgi:hypothetical protein
LKAIETFLLSIGLLVFFAGFNQPRAQDANENEAGRTGQPLYKTGRAQAGVTATGPLHVNAFGKPCMQYDTAARRFLVDKNMFNYTVAVTNTCPRAIKVRICQRDGFGCSSVLVRAYRSTEVVMGFGPNTDAFAYIAKETP